MNIELKVGVLNILESIYILYTVLYAFDSYIFILPEPSVAIKIVTVALSIAGIVAMRHSLKQTDIKNSKKKVFNSTMITAVVMDCLVILSIVIHTPIREMGVL
jgi:ABC-type iron transport system FetAB permease component